MAKATDLLLTDHRMIRKLLEEFTLENQRFSKLLGTVHRVVAGHAWFEDAIFLPALEAEPLLEKRFNAEISQEHKDMDFLLKQLKKNPGERSREQESRLIQFRAIMETHLKKEEDALFPLAERILDSEGLNELGAEMERRKTEVRGLGEA